VAKLHPIFISKNFEQDRATLIFISKNTKLGDDSKNKNKVENLFNSKEWLNCISFLKQSINTLFFITKYDA